MRVAKGNDDHKRYRAWNLMITSNVKNKCGSTKFTVIYIPSFGLIYLPFLSVFGAGQDKICLQKLGESQSGIFTHSKVDFQSESIEVKEMQRQLDKVFLFCMLMTCGLHWTNGSFDGHFHGQVPERLRSQRSLFLTEYARFINQRAPAILKVSLNYKL